MAYRKDSWQDIEMRKHARRMSGPRRDTPQANYARSRNLIERNDSPLSADIREAEDYGKDLPAYNALKIVEADGREGRMYSTYHRKQEYILRVPILNRATGDHKGGVFCFAAHPEEMMTRFYNGQIVSIRKGVPYVMISGLAKGPFIAYDWSGRPINPDSPTAHVGRVKKVAASWFLPLDILSIFDAYGDLWNRGGRGVVQDLLEKQRELTWFLPERFHIPATPPPQRADEWVQVGSGEDDNYLEW